MARTHQCADHIASAQTYRLDAKKKTYGYRERDPLKREQFLAELATIAESQRIYMDESGMDARDDYGYGYSERGQRFHALKSGQRGERINMIAAYCCSRLMAPFTVDGCCNRAVMETWIKSCLIPVLQPGQVLILDNASFHKGGDIESLLESVGCRVLYLPPYSPDLNRIEKCWAWLKSRIRRRLPQTETLRAAMEAVLQEAVLQP